MSKSYTVGHGVVITAPQGIQGQWGRPDLHCRSSEPPSAAVYQQWLDLTLPLKHARPRKITGEMLRRAVRMVRNGYSKEECSRSVGTDVRQWLKQLPPELQP